MDAKADPVFNGAVQSQCTAFHVAAERGKEAVLVALLEGRAASATRLSGTLLSTLLMYELHEAARVPSYQNGAVKSRLGQ